MFDLKLYYYFNSIKVIFSAEMFFLIQKTIFKTHLRIV